MNEHNARLTKTDLTAIEARYHAELAALDEQYHAQASALEAAARADSEALKRARAERLETLGAPPSLNDLKTEGFTESTWLNSLLAFIEGAGYAFTLAIAQLLQAFGAVGLAVAFILLEASRVVEGARALGQDAAAVVTIAGALTFANFVLPIYRLRNVKGQSTLTLTRRTLRGQLEAFWRRMAGKPQAYEVDVYHNRTLHLAEAGLTWATLFFAFYATLAPSLAEYPDLVWYQQISAVFGQSSAPELLKILAGALVAIGGVFGVQSISHEIGVRTLEARPTLAALLQQRRAAHQAEVARLNAEYRAALDEAQARAQAEAAARRDEYLKARAALRDKVTRAHITGKQAEQSTPVKPVKVDEPQADEPPQAPTLDTWGAPLDEVANAFLSGNGHNPNGHTANGNGHKA